MANLKIKRMSNMSINWKLPEEIIILIFSKLPFSNLPNCRIVCKVWNNLVLDYVNNSTFKFLFHPNTFLVCTYDIVPNLKLRTNPSTCNPKIHCLDLDTTNCVATLGFDDVDWRCVTINSSCNGLLQITKSIDDFESYVGILNPMTKEFIQLSVDEEDIYSFGFGFCPKTKQYKLFRQIVEDDADFDVDGQPIITTEVWRFGTTNELQQWKPLSSQPAFIIENDGVYLDGVIYWIGKNITNEFVIFGLDVETEVFETVAILDVGSHSPGYYAYFQQFKATIYLIIKMFAPVSKIQVWIMRAKHLWIKEFVFDISDNRGNFNFIKADEGGVYFLVKKNLFYFDKTGKKIKIRKLFNKKRTKIESIWHLESFHFDSLSEILAGNKRNSFLLVK